jgi:hypothetical protein
MIVQPRDGQLLLIRQTDHAALAGVFAKHWGNADFALPSPRDPVITAAIHHDDGWLLWETAPRMDPSTRRPYQFTDMPLAVHIGFYQAGIEHVLTLAPYAGLLTLMHWPDCIKCASTPTGTCSLKSCPMTKNECSGNSSMSFVNNRNRCYENCLSAASLGTGWTSGFCGAITSCCKYTIAYLCISARPCRGQPHWNLRHEITTGARHSSL